jgi:hypothetical protein
MIKRILFLLIFVCSINVLAAQPAKRGEKIQALKIAYITQVVKLTPEEAQSFWPVYNKYFDEVKQAKKANKADYLLFQEELLNIKKKYKPEFKKILKDDTRVNLVYKAEADFLTEMQKELKKRMQQKQQKRYQKEGNE